MKLSDIILTTDELHLLIAINAITEFDKKNPGNIPFGGIHEIVVSNGIMKADEFDKNANSLMDCGLIDEDYFINEDGKRYISVFLNELDKKIEDNNATCEISCNKIDLNVLLEKIKETAENINWNEVRDDLAKWTGIVASLVKIMQGVGLL